MKRTIIILIITFLGFAPVQSQSYRNAWARYILADICLGGSVDYYKQHIPADPNSTKAVDWYTKGVRLVNPGKIERKYLAPHVLRIVYKGSHAVVDGNNIILTSDGLFDESKVRLSMVNFILSGIKIEKIENEDDPNGIEARQRIQDHVTVSNLSDFERFYLGSNWQVVSRGTHIPANGMLVKLSSDESFYQSDARYMFADMCLGGSKAYYEKSYSESRDPNIFAALQMMNDSVKPINIGEFERKADLGKSVLIVFKGTDNRINGLDVELSTDIPGDAEVRYKMADVALGAPLAFYQADGNNATNKIMFKLLEQGVRVVNLSDFERNKFSDLGMLVVKEGTFRQITGQEVILSSDLTDSEAPLRYCMALKKFVSDEAAFASFPKSIQALADFRLEKGENIVNLDLFTTENQKNGQIIRKSDGKKAEGMDFILQNDRWYNENQVREIIAKTILSNQRIEKDYTPDLREAKNRMNQGVSLSNPQLFAMFDGNLVFHNTKIVANGSHVKLSTDYTDPLFLTKVILLKYKLGLISKSELNKNSSNPLFGNALDMIKKGVTVSNNETFGVKTIPGYGKTIVYKGTETPIKPYDIKLSTDHIWSEAQVRYIMADMALGGSTEFYVNCVKHGDPVAVEPVARWENGIRVVNSEKFQRRFVPDLGWKIVDKGTQNVINPMDVILTSDKK